MKFQRNWKKAIIILSCFVVLATVSALMLPGITLNKYICGFEEHKHSSECYASSSESSLICTGTSLGVHNHTEECYDKDNTLICNQVDFVVHTHDERCFEANGILMCALPEITEHQHTEECYKAMGEETEEQGEFEAILLCEKPEIKLHTHEQNCYLHDESSNEDILICTEKVIKEHQHSTDCFEQGAPILTCVIEEHVHSDECCEQEEVKEEVIENVIEEPLETDTVPNEEIIQSQVLMIGKELEFISDTFTQEQLELSKNCLSYMFRIVGADGNALISSQNIPISGDSQVVTHADANGWFGLTAGQQVQITDITERAVTAGVSTYYIEEAIPYKYNSQYSEITYADESSGTSSAIEGQKTDEYVIYRTAELSSSNSYNITYTGKVNIEAMSYLQINSTISENSDLITEELYEITITLGDRPVATGTAFKIIGTDEIITADDNGSIRLKGNQAAQMVNPILAGTSYSISAHQKDGWQIDSYELSYTNLKQSEPYDNKISYEMPVNETVRITVQSKAYHYNVEIPVTAQFEGSNLDNLNAKRSATLSVTQVNDKDGAALEEQISPVSSEITLTCIGETLEKGQAVAGFSSINTSGKYYYMLKVEKLFSDLDEQFISDQAVYVAEVTLTDEGADISAMYKNGEAIEPDAEGVYTAAFVNALSLVELPATGGIGTNLYIFSGWTLILASALIYITFKKQRKEAN